MNDNEIIRCLGLDNADIMSIDIYYADNELCIDITLNVKVHLCPVCSTPTSRIKSYQLKTIKHSIFTSTQCIIKYNCRRYICPICGKTFYENNPFAYTGSSISIATVSNVLEELKNPSATFTSVAQKYSLSPSSVATIFDNHVDIPRKNLGECISFDETYCFKSDDSNYICVILDHKTKNIIDILPSRKKKDLEKYFSNIPLKERENVKYVATDMWEVYRSISKHYFPSCRLIVDKFHILQELSRKVTRVRINVMNRYKKTYDCLHEEALLLKQVHQTLPPDKMETMIEADRKYYLLKKFNWLLFTNKNLDPNREKQMNKKLGQYLNLYDLYDMVYSVDDDLKEAVELKDRVSRFYKNEKYETAKKELEDIIIEFRTSHIREMNEFADTLSRWKQEIINSFIVIPTLNRKMNNALIENRNKSIKLIKHSSNGYRCWNRFRNRILYSLNSDEKYILNDNMKKGGKNNGKSIQTDG